MKSSICAAVLAACVSTPVAAASIEDAFTSLFVLGDSLSDIGNINPSPLPDPYFDAPGPYSRQFSNGPVFTDVLDDGFNSGLPDPVTGEITARNYAFGGATANSIAPDLDDVAPGNTIDPASPSLLDQIALMRRDLGLPVPPAVPDLPGTPVPGSRALTSIWFGANDVFQALRAVGSGFWDIPTAVSYVDQAADLVVGAVASISTIDGFDDFVVLNLPDIGSTPAFNGNAFASELSAGFNARLAAGLALLEAPGTVIDIVDVASIFDDLIAGIDAGGSPLGLTNGSLPCVVTDDSTLPFTVIAGPCDNPDEFLFWDPVHPTAVAHAELARIVETQVVPLPAGLPLLLAGLGALFVLRRRPVSR